MRALATILWAFLNLWLAVAAFQLDLVGNGLAAYGLFLVMLFIAVLCHEAGHAIAAHRAGARVLRFAALFFAYDFAARKFGWIGKFRGREIGGYVAYDWPPGAGSHRKEAVITAAGPLANLAAATLAIALVPAFAPAPPSSPTVTVEPVAAAPANVPAARLPDRATLERAVTQLADDRRREAIRHFIEAALQVFALLSVGMAVINLVPFDGSDGAKLREHLLRRRRRGGWAERDSAI